MFLAVRLVLSRLLSRRETPTPTPVAPADEAPPGDRAEALWRKARDEASPFKRDALHLEIATAMVDLWGTDLLRFCERHVDDAATAEDVAQRAFIELWQALGRFEGRSTLRTFLFGIALNLCRESMRKESRAWKKRDLHEDDIREAVHSENLKEIDHERERRERLAILEDALAAMDTRDAWLLRSRLVDELTYAQMLPRFQARFGDRIKTVEGLRTAFFHARKTLESKLRGADE